MKAVCEKYGINPTWLLMGEGPMRKGEKEEGAAGAGTAQAAPDAAADQSGEALSLGAAAFHAAVNAPINSYMLSEIISGVEKYLSMNRLELKPKKKAELIVLLYEHFQKGGHDPDPKTVVRYIELCT